MKVKNKVIIAAANAVANLEPKDTVLQLSGTVRYTLAKNLRRLNEANNDLDQVRQGLVKTHKLTNEKNDPLNVLAFNEEWEKLMQCETEITLTLISVDDLKLDKNSIPIHILTGLAGILKEEQE